MEKQFIAFDMDGTLTDSMGMWLNLKHEMVKSYNARTNSCLTLSDEDEKKLESLSLPGAVEYLNGKYATDISYLKDIFDVMFSFYDNDCKIKDGVKELLNLLKADGHRLCVITATPYELAVTSLKHVNIADYFEFILTPEDYPGGKYETDIFFAAAKKFGTDPKNMCLVDDANYAHQSARRAGYRCIGIYDKHRNNDLKEYTDVLYYDYSDMIKDYKLGRRL